MALPSWRAALPLAAAVLVACSAAPPRTPGPTRDPSATDGPGGPVLEVWAKGLAYDPRELTVAAGTLFSIHFRNEDPSTIPHDIDIRKEDGTTDVQEKPTIDGGKEITYTYEALPAGTYTFICSVHPIPAMTGTLIAR